MILSNDGLVAFHYRSYGTFFLQQNRLHNIHRGFTHYKYYRAEFTLGCLFSNKKIEPTNQTDTLTNVVLQLFHQKYSSVL